MDYRKAGKLVVLFVLTVSLFLVGCSEKKYADIPTGETPQKALEAYLLENEIKKADENLEKHVIREVKSGKNVYYIIKGMRQEGQQQSLYVFLVGIIDHKGKYYCEKSTPDFTLGTPGEKIQENTPYGEYVIPLSDDYGDMYIHAGIMFDNRYKPYIYGKKIPVDEDGIFTYVTEKKGVEIDYLNT